MCVHVNRTPGVVASVAVLTVAVVTLACAAEVQKQKDASHIAGQGLAAEERQDFRAAVELYQQAQKVLKGTSHATDIARLHYRIGVCLHEIGKRSEAATALKAFLAGVGEGEVSADPLLKKDLINAQRKLDDIFLPKLTAEQRKWWEEAEDQLRAHKQLADLVLQGETVNLAAARAAIGILLRIQRDFGPTMPVDDDDDRPPKDGRPEYPPVALKLGATYELVKDYRSAAEFYDRYLKAYEKLGYPPPDLREVRVRRNVCAARAEAQPEEERQKQRAKRREHRKSP